MARRSVYAFVGVPSESIMFSQIVNGSDGEIEAELDSMIDLIDCKRQYFPVWMTVPVESSSFEQATAQFTKYMRIKADRMDASGKECHS